VNDGIAQALEEVNHYTAQIIKIEQEIEKIKEEIEEIVDKADSPENEPWYKILRECLKDEKDCLKDKMDCLKEARQFYLQLCAMEGSNLKQSILGKRKCTEIRDDLSAPSSLAKFHGNGCWKEVLKKFGEQIDFLCINMDSDSLPITLMHPVFAEFVQNFQAFNCQMKVVSLLMFFVEQCGRIMNQKRKWLKLPETC